MTNEEIETTWAGSFPDEAFEAFDAAGVDSERVAIVLGKEAANEYLNWIYFNVK